MTALDLTLPDPAANLALDEALLLEAEAGRGGERLRFWQWPSYAVVLGAAGVIADDVDVAACRADGVPLARRSSGGGTVLLGPGCLLFSFVLRMSPELAAPAPSYGFILGRIRDALAPLVPGVELAGTSDLAVAGRKFSGNAQQRKRDFFLHHGTLLCGFDLGVVSRYLKPPPRQPDYRAHRDHAEFLTNLPVEAAELKKRLRAVWGAVSETREWPAKAVERLVAEKYGREEWVMRQ